ncbi:Vid24 family cytoplasmic vesicle protein [Schizosaccharomyces pombe]|uniref:GID complex substrate-recognition subunit 4 n=1 Tax=Schizosaccharomyces pombe (strain 972 / ATCC 24843) TaxID=284812 RepID=GID4_SCHPO|nr:putative Vid24 family vesicle protein [Schizosaccharomyces pombe]Q10079.2 RecName: Full=Uncharacterized protein C3H1.14 [Schizosaccharomyces pombe 972h-]CAA92267.2 cytoplasmic vesicle protein, Vid24 family (predicted) [Schizosaccharomyces pombe]|eukprot:NP_593556.2 putative Vid24 family vesicle protein [Schizosaccharomyces pombe]
MKGCSFLRNGAKFQGKQKGVSSSTLEVHVTILHVNLAKSMLCGFIHVSYTSPNNTSLTTYFEAEIIGNRFTFETKWPEWGASEEIDNRHWKRLGALKSNGKDIPLRLIQPYDPLSRETVYMRWKELAMLDKTVDYQNHNQSFPFGISYEGFYYISFSQSTGKIKGYYYHHSEPEKVLFLELNPIIDRTFPVIEFQ